MEAGIDPLAVEMTATERAEMMIEYARPLLAEPHIGNGRLREQSERGPTKGSGAMVSTGVRRR